MNVKSKVIYLQQLTQELLQLSIADEDFAQKVETIQEQQSEVRNEIQLYKDLNNITIWPDDISDILRSCYQMEVELSSTLANEQEKSRIAINKLETAKKIRQVYSGDDYSEFGSYIDRSN
ncbi:hypothetical protein P0100_19660 [Yersinia pestis]|nr:hypothetical protein [Yersinia pestis]